MTQGQENQLTGLIHRYQSSGSFTPEQISSAVWDLAQDIQPPNFPDQEVRDILDKHNLP